MKTVQISGVSVETGEVVIGDGRTTRGDRIFLHVDGKEVEVRNELAEKKEVIDEVIKALNCRKGFDDWWGDIENDIKSEIKTELRNIIKGID